MFEKSPTSPPTPVAPPPKTGPAIFVMPEGYRGGTGKLVQPKVPEPVKPAVVVIAPPPPPPPVSAGLTKPVVKKKSHAKLIVIIGLLFIALLGIGGYFLLNSATLAPAPAPVPIPEPVPEPIPAPIPEPIPEPVGPTSGIDTDGDGLTDVEENSIYRSELSIADTDQDGYSDGLEVVNRYNPAAVAPKTLLEAGIVRPQVSGDISFLYPVTWIVQEAEDGSMILTTATGETITFRTVQSGEGPTPDAVAFTTKNGLQGYRPARIGDPFYLGIPEGDLAVFTTSLGTQTTIEYTSTIDLIVNSVMFN